MVNPCTFLVQFDDGTPSTASEITAILASGDAAAKATAMKRAISLLLNGDPVPRLSAAVDRHVLPSDDHAVQKLLLLHLELTIDTRAAAAAARKALIVDNLRRNLGHPNEFVRGATLRFLRRRAGASESEPWLLRQIVPSILANLHHRHPFVRRHALSAVTAIHGLPRGDGCQLIPGAQAIAERALAAGDGEQDAAARRNAFLLLRDSAPDRAVVFLLANADRAAEWPELMQMAALDLIVDAYRSKNHAADKGGFVKIILSFISAPSAAAVVFQCAGALLSMTSAPTAAHVAVDTYCKLLCLPSDDTMKLIVLERLQEMCATHRRVMEDKVVFLLRASFFRLITSLDVRMKVLGLVLDLLTPINVEEVVLCLKEEVEKGGEHKHMLMLAIHVCALKYPEQGVAPSFGSCLCPLCPLTQRMAVPATWLAPEAVPPQHGRRRRRRR